MAIPVKGIPEVIRVGHELVFRGKVSDGPRGGQRPDTVGLTDDDFVVRAGKESRDL